MADWKRIDLSDARIDGLTLQQQGVLAWGELGGAPYAAKVDPDGTVTVAELPGSGAVTSATYQECFELVVGSPPLHVAGDFPGGFSYSEFFVPDWTVVENPHRMWVGCGDEDAMYAVADADGRLQAVDPGIGLAGEPSELVLFGDRLLVAGGEVGLRVAGVLRGADGTPEPQRWTCWEIEQGWKRVALDPVPDAFTDLVECYAPLTAGHRGLRPLVWDDNGVALEVPDVALDAAYPWVSLASEDGHGLALQTEDGPQLWTRTDDGWTSVDLPTGYLVVARRDLGDEDRVWVVVDGALWTASGG